MTTTLTLDTPEARRALSQCYGLLLRLAERRRQRTADLGELGGQTQVGGGTSAPMGQSTQGSIADER